MRFSQIFVEALRSMLANPLRTSLTMLGIIIGIASVTMMLSVGDAVKAFINKELQILGSNLFIVNPGGNRTQGVRARQGTLPSLSIQDAGALNELKSLRGAAPALQGFFQINYGTDNSNSVVLGVTPEMFTVRSWKLGKGSPITDADVKSANKSVVIGKKIAENYFYKADPIGRTVRIENVPFIIVGVLEGEGQMFDGADLGEMILIPITTARATLIRSPFPQNVHYIVAQAIDEKRMGEAEADMKDVLRDRHRIRGDQEDDFRIQNLAAFAEAGKNIGRALAIGLGLVGAISLVVGGIGIMNIMLVSVTERTREIGIRMAIGAKPKDVLVQFLSEAVVICLAGGAVGVALAAGGAALVSLSGKFIMTVGLGDIAVAVLFASAVGIFFGFYPARRAANLQPVECLRYE